MGYDRKMLLYLLQQARSRLGSSLPISTSSNPNLERSIYTVFRFCPLVSNFRFFFFDQGRDETIHGRRIKYEYVQGEERRQGPTRRAGARAAEIVSSILQIQRETLRKSKTSVITMLYVCIYVYFLLSFFF
jgi:hypothetical protein